jgi:hypothetical protein
MQTLENADRQQELDRPMTETEENRHKTGTPRGKIAEERIWNKSPDRLAIKIPTTKKLGEFVTLDFKRMSDVTDQYVTRSKHVAEAQYESIKSTLERTFGPQGWLVRLRSFIATGSTRQPILLQGPTNRHQVHCEKGTHDQRDPVPGGPRPPFITSLQG